VQSPLQVIGAPMSTTSKSVTLIAPSEPWLTPTSDHLCVVKRSLCAVSVMFPPSARSIPYFCSAFATTRAPSVGRDESGKSWRSRNRTPYGGAFGPPEVGNVECVAGWT
jgi:hypothetical protein